HMDIAELGPGNPLGGVAEPGGAIRDPIFWRWHRLIDNASFQWQEKQRPRDYASAPDRPPPVRLRSGDLMVATASALTTSGFKDVHDESGGETQAAAVFGGASWDRDFSGVAPQTNGLSQQMG